MHKDIQEVFYSEEVLKEKIEILAKRINEDYKGKKLLMVVILKGSFIFASDLIKKIDVDCELDFMAISSYGNGTESSGCVKVKKEVGCDVENKNVLIVEDIVDSGITLNFLVNYFKDKKVNSVEVVSLLNKSARRKIPVNIKYIGFEVADEFLVGYGLDYAERYRNIPYIGILKPEMY